MSYERYTAGDLAYNPNTDSYETPHQTIQELEANGDVYDIISKGVINQNAPTTALKLWSGTTAQYNAIATKDANTVYYKTDAPELSNFYTKTETDSLLDDKVDLDASNLSQTGKNIANWSTNLTNCVTNIPQDIKLELSSGTLTLKAGSKCYVKGDTTTPTYTISSDKTATQTTNGSYFAFYDGTNLVLYLKTAYDYTTLPSTISLPLAEITVSNSAISSIDQVFNGFGYIGSTVFVFPGVKGLIPNGRNEDGSLKTVEYTNQSLAINTMTGSINRSRMFILSSNGSIDRASSFIVSDDNYLIKEEDGTVYNAFVFATCPEITSSVIKTFMPKTVFRALDYNDKSIITGWGMPDYSTAVSRSWDTSYFADRDTVICYQTNHQSGNDNVGPRVSSDNSTWITLYEQNAGTSQLKVGGWFFCPKGWYWKMTGGRNVDRALVSYIVKGEV